MIIGLSGPVGAGKDVIANFLSDKYGYKKFKFANKLKDIVAVILNFYKEDFSHRLYFENREWKENAVVLKFNNVEYTPRTLLQLVGTELFRDGLHPDFWVEMLKQDISKHTKPNDIVIISDVRFLNEVNFVKTEGVLVYVNRLENNNQIKTNHLSESQFDVIEQCADKIILNNYPSLNDLYNSLQYFDDWIQSLNKN